MWAEISRIIHFARRLPRVLVHAAVIIVKNSLSLMERLIAADLAAPTHLNISIYLSSLFRVVQIQML